MNGIILIVLILIIPAFIYGVIPWLQDWIEHPGKNLLILLLCIAGLGLWLLFSWCMA